MTSGIYQIRCNPTGKVYIGSSCRIEKRWREHELHLIAGTHVNPHLQAAWNKYGSDSFELVIIEECGKETIRLREQQILDAADWSNLLNVSKGASGGNTLSAEQAELARQRRVEMNKKMWEERRANGWSMSEDQRRQIGEWSKGRIPSDETRKKKSDAMNQFYSSRKNNQDE
jgi:group I intron endonuclease